MKRPPAEAAAADADGERPPLRDGLAALFNDDTALELAAVDHGFRLAYPVRPGGVGEADQPLELAAVEFGLAVGRQQGGIDIGDADLRGDGVDLAAVKDDLRVALALDDHNAVFARPLSTPIRPLLSVKLPVSARISTCLLLAVLGLASM